MSTKTSIGRISYEDKIDYKIQGEDEHYKITAENMNEIKRVFNDGAERIEEALNNSNSGMTTHIVDTLPESGESTDIYFLTVGDNYIPFMYVEGKWVSFGTVRPIQLLINNDFKINQRGKNQYNFNSETFGLDCWQHRQGSYYNAIIVTQIDGGGCHVELNTEFGAGLRQYLNVDDFKLNETYTTSISIDNVVYTGTLELIEASDNVIIENEIFKLSFFKKQESENVIYSLWFKNGNTEHDINYCDLFEGDIAYHHVNEDKTIELMKCQNRLVVYNEVMLPCNFSYINKDYDSISANLYLPTNFKGQPNISYDTKEMRSQHGGTTYTDFSIVNKKLYGTNIIRIIWKKDSGTFPDTIKDAYVYMKNLVISCEET